MSGLVWDFQSSARISRAVRKVEQTGQSQFDDFAFMPRLAGSLDWVKTPSTLPGGYDGTDPLDGVKVVRLPDGTIHEHPQAVFILDPNGTPLATDTIYPAQFAGTYDDAGTIQGLYLVQAGRSASGTSRVGETCFGTVNTTHTLSGGVSGYGYTEATVTIPDPSDPTASTTETWRLAHSAASLGRPLFHAQNASGSWQRPANSGLVFKFQGVRGSLVSAGVYNCTDYYTLPIALPTKVGWLESLSGLFFQAVIGASLVSLRCSGLKPMRPFVRVTGTIGSSNASGAALNLTTTNGTVLNTSGGALVLPAIVVWDHAAGWYCADRDPLKQSDLAYFNEFPPNSVPVF